MDPELEKRLKQYREAGASDEQLRSMYNAYLAANPLASAAPTPPPAITARDMGRSAVQGATLGFGDELGLTDPAKEAAFKQNYPTTDFLSKLAGGALAPILATYLGPEALATAGGSAAMGGALGGVTAAGEDNGASTGGRVKAGLENAPIDALAALIGHGATTAIGKGAGAVIDRMFPTRAGTRAVGKAASELLTPADAAAADARQSAINALAPGGSSPATAAVPAVGRPIPRFRDLVRGVGAGPTAAASAEQSFTNQLAAQQMGRRALGAEMDKLVGDVPVTPRLRAAMSEVRDVLGGKTPDLPENDFYEAIPATAPRTITTAQSPNPSLRDAIANFWDRQTAAYLRNPGNETVAQSTARAALERHGAEGIVSPPLQGAQTVVPGDPAHMAPEAVDIQVLRDALSRLRFLSRQAARKGIDANGLTTRDIEQAKSALQEVLYDHSPEFQDLDQNYGKLADETRATNRLLNEVQASRRSHPANTAFGTGSASLGGSLPQGRAAMATSFLNSLLTNKPAVADAVARMVTKPGASTADLLAAAPGKPRVGPAMRAGLAASLPPALQGLFSLFPQ